MYQVYGILPTVDHQACMVIGFGSAGHFDEALTVMKTMPSSYNSIQIWLALLVSCKKWGNVKLGTLAFDQALQLDRSCSGAYVLMENLYAISGMLEDAQKIESMRLKYALAWRESS
jgi:pentatricopeptide repeat protein